MVQETITEILFWCSIINIGLLAWWVLIFITAHDWIYQMHSRWFKLPVERFDAIHYAGMAFFKICIFLFNIVPYVAIRIIG